MFPFSVPEHPSQACDYKDSELRFEERVHGIAEGLQKPRGAFRGGPRGLGQRESGRASAHLPLDFTQFRSPAKPPFLPPTWLALPTPCPVHARDLSEAVTDWRLDGPKGSQPLGEKQRADCELTMQLDPLRLQLAQWSLDSCFFSSGVRVRFPRVRQEPGSDFPKSVEAGPEATGKGAREKGAGGEPQSGNPEPTRGGIPEAQRRLRTHKWRGEPGPKGFEKFSGRFPS